MATFQAPRGTQDILPNMQPVWQHITGTAALVAEQFGYQKIETPTYESINLFQRAVGEATDIMEKELFLVKGIRSEEHEYALRPEGTAGIVRAYIEHGMHTMPQPVKLWSLVNNFRYDRPQKGRYREHHQFDIEIFGEKGPFADAWVIYATWQFFQKLGLQGIQLQLNSLGTAEERAAYRQALVEFLTPQREQLSEDSQRRLELNPLRIIDSKDENDQRIVANAPRLHDHFGESSQNHFSEVQQYLHAWGVPFVLNASIVRGLDYYCHTCFEWTSTEAGGQQSSLGGGGRYDGLLTELGGPDVGGVGAGIGLERVALELERQGISLPEAGQPDIALIAADAVGKAKILELIPDLLAAGKKIEVNLSKPSVGAQMKAADRAKVRFAAVIGEREVNEGSASVKNLGTGEDFSKPLSELSSL